VANAGQEATSYGDKKDAIAAIFSWMLVLGKPILGAAFVPDRSHITAVKSDRPRDQSLKRRFYPFWKTRTARHSSLFARAEQLSPRQTGLEHLSRRTALPTAQECIGDGPVKEIGESIECRLGPLSADATSRRENSELGHARSLSASIENLNEETQSWRLSAV